MEQRELVVIGGGPAGYVAAIRARQLGSRVTLIEGDTLGGTCLNRGCIPLRAFFRGAEFLELSKKAREYGVNLGEAEVDFLKMVTRKDTIVKTGVGGVKLLMDGNDIEVLKGRGRLLSSSEVEVVLEDGSTNSLKASKIILATGTRAARLPVPGGDSALTTEEVLNLSEIPGSLVIIGGGAIGMAFATIFNRLGTSTIVLEESSHILPGVDTEVVTQLLKELKRHKIQVQTDAHIMEIKDSDTGEKQVVLNIEGVESLLTAQHVLAAEERLTNVEEIGLEAVGVKTHNGSIEVDGHMETSVSGIMAAGDVVGTPRLAHVAFAEGRIAAENALGRMSEINYTTVPQCISTFPEIASVGLTEDEASSQGYRTRIGRFPLAANGMATILSERRGFIKIISEADYNQVLGVHIIGANAGELIAEAALAVGLEITTHDMGATIHTHPTLSEALMEASLDVTGGASHVLAQD